MSGHDDWSFYSNPEEVEKLMNRVQQLEEEVAHSNWHNAVYRAALCSVKGGLEAAKDKFWDASRLKEPLCKECEKDYFLHKLQEKDELIKSLQRQLSPPSPILSSSARKRSRANSLSKEYTY